MRTTIKQQDLSSLQLDDAVCRDICKFGDTVITQACASIYQKKKAGQTIDKGIAFPTCVSLNHVVCHNCPLNSESGAQEPLKDGDLVKIDLGVHVDGYIAVLADTIVCGAAPTPEAPIAEETGNIFTAAHLMSEVAQKLVRPGRTNHEVTDAWEKIAETFGVSDGTITFISTASVAFFVLGAGPMGWLADRIRRGPIVGVASLAFGFFVFLSGAAVNAFMLFVARFFAGISKANTITVHSTLLADTYPIATRGRMYATNAGVGRIFGAASPILVGGIADTMVVGFARSDVGEVPHSRSPMPPRSLPMNEFSASTVSTLCGTGQNVKFSPFGPKWKTSRRKRSYW